jgi:hypothetical protein
MHLPHEDIDKSIPQKFLQTLPHQPPDPVNEDV